MSPSLWYLSQNLRIHHFTQQPLAHPYHIVPKNMFPCFYFQNISRDASPLSQNTTPFPHPHCHHHSPADSSLNCCKTVPHHSFHFCSGYLVLPTLISYTAARLFFLLKPWIR